jgi:hypothetical protein
MSNRRPRRRNQWIVDRPTQLAILCCVLLAVAPVAIAPVGASSGAITVAATDDAPAVDILFVFDNSESTNEDRYHMAREIGALANAVDRGGIDARYGLVTYNDRARTVLRPTHDFDAFDRAMHFQEEGNVERAADAILHADDLTAEDRETVLVVVTDEDDDSANATRDRAVSALDGVHFVAVSPATPYEASCAVHSPPCDDRSDNELRTMVERVDGDWIDEGEDAATIVDRIGAILGEVAGVGSSLGSRGSGVDFDVTATSVNRTTAEVGDSFAFTQRVRNIAGHEEEYRAYLSYGGYIYDERRVTVPEDESRNVTIHNRFDRPGRYEVLISHVPVATIDVTPPRNATVAVRNRRDGAGVLGNVSDARANGSVLVGLTNATLADPAAGRIDAATVGIGAVDVRPDHDVAFDVGFRVADEHPNGTSALPPSVNHSRYVTVNSSLGEELTGIGFEYAARSRDTTLYRYDASTAAWVPVERTAAEDGARRWLTARTEGPFAIGTREPVFSVSGVTLVDRTVTVGETVRVRATVVNEGAAPGHHRLNATVDGRTVDSATVAVNDSESRQVELAFAPERAGEYAIDVGGVTVEGLQVDPAPTETSTPASTTADRSTPNATLESTGRTLRSAIGTLAAVPALVVGALGLAFLLRRRR